MFNFKYKNVLCSNKKNVVLLNTKAVLFLNTKNVLLSSQDKKHAVFKYLICVFKKCAALK